MNSQNKKKKVLFVSTVFGFLDFEKSDMSILKELGYEIHTATNMKESDWLKDSGSLDYLGVIKHQIDFDRIPFSKKSFVAYKQLRKLVNEEFFDAIHTHTPVASVILRLAAFSTRRHGTKVIYTDHGFHFHKSSPKMNWLLYYPMEYLMAFFTDMIITVNKEDFSVIQKFPVKYKRYIPSVGIDAYGISRMKVDKTALREKFGIPQDAFLILSLGELSARKNQEVIIRALAKIEQANIYYLLLGTGEMMGYLQQLSNELGVGQRVIFAGQQPYEMVKKIVHIADLGALPSKIEGLGLAGIEIMAAGKPVVSSNVHGINDYVINNVTGLSCAPTDVEAFADIITRITTDKKIYDYCCKNAENIAKKFDITIVSEMMRNNYKEILN